MPNQYNIEYIPVRATEAGRVAWTGGSNQLSITRFFRAENRERIWRATRISLHDTDGRELKATAGGLATPTLMAELEANRIYLLGISYYGVCEFNILNLAAQKKN